MLVSLLVMFWPSPATSEWEVIQKAREVGMVFREEVAVFDPSPGGEGLEAEGSKGDDSFDKDITEGQAQGAFQEVIIPSGSGLDSIAIILWEHGIIRDKELFTELVQEMGAVRSLKAGIYSLPRDSDSYQVLKILKRGDNRHD